MKRKKTVCGVKVCPLCNVPKDYFTDFYPRQVRGRALAQAWCKQCVAARLIEWRALEESKRKVRIANHVRYKRKRKEENVRFAVTIKLGASKMHGKKRGHVGCTASIDELEKSFTRTCQCCGDYIGMSICLDHCHETGKFRGWLCHACNRFIGLAKESSTILQKAINYLNK